MGETQVPSDTGARAKLSLPNASGTGAALTRRKMRDCADSVRR